MIDIVERLRSATAHADFLKPVEAMCHAAAAEIERLRQDLDFAKRDAENWKREAQGQAELRDLFIRERDEARRMLCSMNETGLRMNESDKKREAKRRGWDCFKENTND